MSRLIRILFLCAAAVVVQVTLSWRIAFLGAAPDFLLILMALLTDWTASFSAFCAGGWMALLLNASVGNKITDVNLILYPLIGYFSDPFHKRFMKLAERTKRFRFPVHMAECLVMGAAKQITYLGYLFLTGGTFDNISLVRRPVIACLYSALLVPVVWPFVHKALTWHPFAGHSMRP